MIDILNSVARHMKIDFEEISSKVNHRGEKGTIREEDFMTYMRQFIPLRYNMTKGEIVCAGEKHSRQIDCIIYDALNTPILINRESSKVIPIESVYITIEVKSYLNKDSLKECVENIKSVRRLPKNPITKHHSYVSGYVFAYTSDSLEIILKHLNNYNKEVDSMHQISCICVLDKGLIVNVDKRNIKNISQLPTANTIPIIAKNSEDSTLLLFYLILMQYLNSTIISPADLIQYAKVADLYKISLETNLSELPQGSYYDGYDLELVKQIHGGLDLMKRFEKDTVDIYEIKEFLEKYIPLNLKLHKNKVSKVIVCEIELNENEILQIVNEENLTDKTKEIYSSYLRTKKFGIEVYT